MKLHLCLSFKACKKLRLKVLSIPHLWPLFSHSLSPLLCNNNLYALIDNIKSNLQNEAESPSSSVKMYELIGDITIQ